MRLFGFVWWNFCVVAIILFCLKQRMLCPNLYRIKCRCNYFAHLSFQLSLPVTAKHSERSTKWWVSMGVCYSWWVFEAHDNFASFSASLRKYRISVFSVCFTWIQHCLTFSLISQEFEKKRLFVFLSVNDIFGRNRLRDAATAFLSRCLSFVYLSFETGSEM